MCLSPRRRPPHRPAAYRSVANGPGDAGAVCYAWPTWLTMAVNSQGSRAAAGTIRGASSGWCLAHNSPEVSSKDLRETRRQARS